MNLKLRTDTHSLREPNIAVTEWRGHAQPGAARPRFGPLEPLFARYPGPRPPAPADSDSFGAG